MQLLLGSGKTAVLVERIIHKILYENINIDELLVVTFTNAAASEMRQRILDAIYEYLEENPNDKKMQEQIVKMGKSNICTIHSFCLDVIRNHFYEIGISPNIRIGQQSEMELLKRQVLEDLFEEKYEQEDEKFLLLINTYTSYKGDEPLKDLVLNITRNIDSNPFPEEWLENSVNEFKIQNKEQNFAQTKWGKILLSNFKQESEMCILELQKIKQELSKFYELDKFTGTIQSDIDSIQEINYNLDDWDKAYELANKMKWVTWPRDTKVDNLAKDIAKEKRDQIKKKWTKIKDKFFTCNSKQANEEIQDMYPKLNALKDLVLEFNDRFAKEKLDKNVMDFHDIEHFALKILVEVLEDGSKRPTKIACDLQEKFKEIAIDEYQDSNLIQEYILSTISNGNNIFMVGDVKQSIYKFRQARPELFLQKYETYKTKAEKEQGDCLKIQLFKNFRSRQNILAVTNLVFETIMSKELGDIEYNETEYLNLGSSYPELKEELSKTQIHIIDLKKDEDIEDLEEIEQAESSVLEAKFVANKIQHLIKSKYQIYDKKIGGNRDITYKDIVILLRSTASLAPIYEKELTAIDIPVFCDTTSQYLDTIEIQTILSLLKIIDNPMQDIPLVCVLRSPIGEFDDNELIQIKLNGQSSKNEYFYEVFLQALQSEDIKSELKQKMQKFLDNIKHWQEQNEYMPLNELIWQIYLDTGYYHYVSLMPNGTLRQANLKMLFDRAREYEKASFKGLFNFINYIDGLKLASGDMDSAKIISENEDVVRIMSIHKSKGLEFPVVVLASSAKKFNMQELNEPISLHQDLGIGPKYIDEKRKIEYPSLEKLAINEMVAKETVSEEMRILYVALTRAKEKLIITGISKDFDKDYKAKIEKLEIENKDKISPNLLKQYKSYLDWIELVYIKKQEQSQKLMQLQVHTIQELKETLTAQSQEKQKGHFEEKSKEYSINEQLQKQLEWEYKYRNACDIPTMMSVSKIKQAQMEKNIPSLDDCKQQASNKISTKKVPEFLKDEISISATQKGSLMHLCLQNLDEKVDYTKEKIENLIDMLVQKQLITRKEAESISKDTLLAYTKSDLFNELKMAKNVQKEAPFYMDIPAKEIFEKNLDEKVLVQGIIDLYYINNEDELILVDYKTDFVKAEIELINKYKKQLEIYKKALQEATNKKVDKVYVYSLYLQKTIEINC